MIDIENYGRSIAWMKQNLLALQQSPGDKLIHDAVLQSFEVTFNISEEVLRKTYVALGTDEAATNLSFREIVHRAHDEGLGFTSNMRWIEYSMALESARKEFIETADLNVDAKLRSQLFRYVDDLERFLSVLGRKLVAGA